MSTSTALANLSLILLVVTAAAYDVRARRIPNWLVGTGLIAALIAQGIALGVGAGSLAWLGGAAIGMGLCIGLYLLGGMGAGDVKLMGAIGAFMGPFGALHVALVSFVAGGVLALVMVLLRKEARRSVAGVSTLLLSLPFGGKAMPSQAQGPKHGGTIQLPYAVAFAAGTLLVKWGVL
ncbi:prepilin peptidase [Ralstonia solanacearum]|uniref:A24 family peptidase n=1 Tax=Ralstonia solanacearum TaxID=305 RepID=UPI0018D04273|nr:prepilin peptidase [Ralstonia solanacearum]